MRRRARSVYDAIAAAEARAHGCPVGDVHFHEVGALDAVADVVGVCYAMELLAPERVVASPVHVGSGTVRCAHGVMPVPTPATSYLLEGVPIYGGAVRGELCTPTGAALLREFASSFGSMPAMVTEHVGIGVGTKQFEQANCVRAFLGDTPQEREQAVELRCNLDDMTPEELGFTLDTYWVQAGGADIYQWLDILQDRIPCVHFKDMAVSGWNPIMAPVGDGNLNFPAIVKKLNELGKTKYALVEQDTCQGSPFDCLQRSHDYLRSLGL